MLERVALPSELGAAVDWVIVGGESGQHARPCDEAWVRSIRDQCRTADVPCFIKQLGARPLIYRPGEGTVSLTLRDRKGGDWNEWPEELRVREFPRNESEAKR